MKCLRPIVLFVCASCFRTLSAEETVTNELSHEQLAALSKFLQLDRISVGFSNANDFVSFKYYAFVDSFLTIEHSGHKSCVVPDGKYVRVEILCDLAKVGKVVRYAFVGPSNCVFWLESEQSMPGLEIRPKCSNIGVDKLCDLCSDAEFSAIAQEGIVSTNYMPTPKEMTRYRETIKAFDKCLRYHQKE